MVEFLQWLSGNPAVLMAVISLIALLVVTFGIACIWAVKTGGKVTLWPPSVKGSDRIVGASATLKVEAGVVKMPSEREVFYNTRHEVFLKKRKGKHPQTLLGVYRVQEAVSRKAKNIYCA